MNLSEVLRNPAAVGVLSFVAGIAGTVISQQLTGRRRLLSYTVGHTRVGMSADDALFGNVRVTWNDNPTAHLYLSTLVLTNESLSDFKDVRVTVYTNDTHLLTQRTQILGTPDFLQFTSDYQKSVAVADGEQPTQQQRDTYSSHRDYDIPTLNRGQKVQFDFLNAAKTAAIPSIWLSINHSGVKLKFHAPRPDLWGVDVLRATIAGLLISSVVMVFILTQVHTLWIAAVAALIWGLISTVPGALALRAARWLRNWYGG